MMGDKNLKQASKHSNDSATASLPIQQSFVLLLISPGCRNKEEKVKSLRILESAIES